MKTDALFYELFQLEPQSLFDLVCLNMEGEYIFESITVKTTEKRFLTVLKPLILENKNQLSEFVPKWKAEIDSLNSPEEKANLLEELLEYAILQRFPQLTLKEVRKMIQLTPLDKTVAGQELILFGIKKGVKKGKEEGLKKGELIGEIRTLQRIMKYSQSSTTELARKTLKALRALLKQLKS